MINLAIAIVGITQVIKNLIPWKGNRVVWTLVAIAVGALIAFLQHITLSDAVIGICGATIFYDTIYQGFKKIFASIGGTDESISAR